MIHDRLDNRHVYAGLPARLVVALAYLESCNTATANGDYPLEGDSVFARHDVYVTQPESLRRWESHRRYVDVQYIVSGRELILHSHVDNLRQPTAYAAGNDVILYGDCAVEPSRLEVQAGEFVILFQHDGHKPGVAAGVEAEVRKIVVKVDLQP